MVMGSSRGLYPELTYVLDAITATEEKLLLYLRELRAERETLSTIGDQPTVLEVPHSNPTAHFSIYTSPEMNPNRLAVPTQRTVANQTLHSAARSMREAEPRPVEAQNGAVHLAPPLPPKMDTRTWPAPPVEPLQPVKHQTQHTAVHATPTVEPTFMNDEISPMYVPPELPPAVWPGTSDADYSASPTARRNYNFFAELDARLAALENQEGSPTAE
jgi:hypothetical protein